MKWEYMVKNITVSNQHMFNEELNILGGDGWEMVNSVPITPLTRCVGTLKYVVTMKRPIKDVVESKQNLHG
jgi:hypothetical protein